MFANPAILLSEEIFAIFYNASYLTRIYDAAIAGRWP